MYYMQAVDAPVYRAWADLNLKYIVITDLLLLCYLETYTNI